MTDVVDDADTNQKDFSFIFSACAVFIRVGKACPSTDQTLQCPSKVRSHRQSS